MRNATVRTAVGIVVLCAAALAMPLAATGHELPGCEGHWYGLHKDGTVGQTAGLSEDLVVAQPLGIIDATGSAGVQTVYVDDRAYVGGNGIWVYIENNGTGYLQRGGPHPVLGDADADICDDGARPTDLLIL